jgi:Flp pilus assembly protein TadG
MVSLKRLRPIAERERNDAGAAALEFGLMAPLLILLLVGTIEIGTSVYQGMQAQNAAEAGALYASQNGFDVAGISNAVVNATTNAGLSATPVPSQFCGCPGAGGLTAIGCELTCADGSAPGQYVRVNAQIAHQPLLSFSGLTMPATLTGEAVIRIN